MTWPVSSAFCVLLVLSYAHFSNGIERNYHIAAVEEEWDYAPTNQQRKKGVPIDQDSAASVFSKNNPTNRIGKVYKKAMYRECTDPSCSTIKEHPEYLGLLGPIIRAEIGDVLRIHFTNNATRKYSVHPHGLFYKKNSEGALYEDNTSGKDKEDDGVSPNEKYTYVWEVKKEHGPTEADSDCLTWVYHSHVDPNKDVNTGLVGALIICKKGTFVNNKHKDIDKDFLLLFTVMDENESWLLDQNIKDYCPKFNSSKDDEDFQESNKMHVINGYFYGNIPGLEMCSGDRVDWHVFGMGSEVDIHSVFFQGHTVTIDGHRTDVGSVFPARSLTAHMTARNTGSWLLKCLVNDHVHAGMFAYYNVTKCPGKSAPKMKTLTGKVRKYFIAAEERLWDYAPSGVDNFNGGSLTNEDNRGHEFFAKGNGSIGGKYWKALFVEYSDSTFSHENPKNRSLGFMGPVIRAEVGETINVTFKNKASFDFNVEPHGVLITKTSNKEGYSDMSVKPNKTVNYIWTVPEHVGPTKTDPACITYVYTSAVNPIKDVYSGLIGPLLVCKKGTLDQHGKQKNIDKEFVLLFIVMNENDAWYIDRNAREFAGSFYEPDPEKESNMMHGLNGYLFANLPGLDMCMNDTVSWHLIGLGNEVDIHGAYFHGQTFLLKSNRKDSVHLIPGTFETVIMKPDNPGEWAVVCRTNDHYDAGMVAKFRVRKCGASIGALSTPNKRTYYIAAVEVDWDYAPSGRNILRGVKLEDDENSKISTASGTDRIGHVYKKAVYREFIDNSFTKEKERPEYFGILGPMIKAEVGETIEVVFKNKASRPYSIHPHGVLYDKSNEGALYLDNTTLKADDSVGPGKTYTYIWNVPSRAGPSNTDNECLTWMYYSNVDPSKDTSSGLLGPLIICKKGSLEDSSKPKNVDHEFPLYFTVVDENLSWYLDENINKFTKTAVDKEDDDFVSSNQMKSINGRVFGNLKDLNMTRGDRINWYLMTLGNEVDMHDVHFHGQTVLHRTVADHREDVIDLFPGTFMTVKMITDSIGEWLLHCHVNDHLEHGMEVLYSVQDKKDDKPTSAGSHTIVSVFSVGTTVLLHFIMRSFA